MASNVAAQIRQGSVGLGQRQEEEKEGRWDKCKAKKKEERAGSQPKRDKQQNAVEDQAIRRVVRT